MRLPYKGESMKRLLAVLMVLAFGTTVGAQTFGFNYTRVFASGTTVAQQVKATSGVLHTVIEGLAGGSFQVSDRASGCALLQDSDPSIIVDGFLGPGVSLEIDAHFVNGLCVVANGLSSTKTAITVTWQ